MTPSQFQALEALFHGALEQTPGAARQQWIAQHCPPPLAASLQDLLAAHEEEQRPPAPAAPAPLPRCGAFQADSVLGAGGMGMVFLAHRMDGQFEQKVALKLLRSVARTASAKSRLRSERQILAQLHHPNIAALHDGGVTREDEPYVVMEYVDGLPLDRFCDERRLALAARIDLFQQLLGAVDYLHRNLIVHGDLKPSNILVTGSGAVKLLDFGTSRFLDEEEITSTWAAALTPRYASPEQIRGERQTTAADIYSLGLILYELLAGAPPFGDRKSLLATLERGVHETKPAAPRDAVTPEAARNRGMLPANLRQELSGDLEAVLRKAIAYDPERRYRSVSELAADLAAYRQGRPVAALRQTPWYRARKFVRRHQLAVGAALLAVAVLAGSGAYAWRQQQAALAQARRAALASTFFTRLFQSINPVYGGSADLTLDRLLAGADALSTTMLAGDPYVRSQFQISLADHLLMNGGTARSIPMAERALSAARASGDPSMQAEALAILAEHQMYAEQCRDALRNITAARQTLNAGGRAVPREWRIAVALVEREVVSGCGGDTTEQAPYLQEALRLARQIPANSVAEVTPPRTILAMALLENAKGAGCPAANPYLRELHALAPHDPALRVIDAEGSLFEALCDTGAARFQEAAGRLQGVRQTFAAAFGPRSVMTFTAQAFLAYALANSADPARALEAARAALPDAACNIPTMCGLSRAMAMQAMLTAGAAEEALPLARAVASDPTYGFIGQAGEFVACRELGRAADAEPFRGAAARWASALPAGSRWRRMVETQLR